MATEITQEGYQSIKSFIEEAWKYVELRDEFGERVIRLGVGDSRVTWTHPKDEQYLELQIVVSGGDKEITLPQTFASSAIFSVIEDGSELAKESFSAFVMEESGDKIIVAHQFRAMDNGRFV